jgi:murein L,D-transpeptidase YafK
LAVALAGCQTDGTMSAIPAKALKPLSPAMLAELEKRTMPLESPILVRIFKEEAELEVWKQNADGQFALLKAYPICRWSGELGPKIKQGDRQAPEGFYAITPGQMNPNSNYYLSFNLGFPNAYDKANDRDGQFLMVHGDCSSAGCYAMTDEQMGEIYALGRESFFGGQKSFQVQAYPFRMTPLNMAKHRNSPHVAFWKMLKEGNDQFEVTRQEPKVDVCEKRYVFNAGAPANALTPLSFNARGKCPAYEVPNEIAEAVAAKRDQDEREFAALVRSGTPTVAARTGNDGGMHPTFVAKLRPNQPTDDPRFMLASSSSTPALPANVNPPKNVAAALASEADTPTATVEPVVQRPARTASAEPLSKGSLFGSLFSDSGKSGDSGFGASVSSLFGLRGAKDDVPPPAPKPGKATASTVNAGQPRPTPPKPVVTAAPIARPAAPITPPRQAAAEKPALPPTALASTAAVAPAATPGLMAGAAPVVQSSNFESRWGGFR